MALLLLKSRLANGRLLPVVLEIYAAGPPRSHAGEEFVYVAQGAIEVDIEGELHIARQGDSVYYAGGLRHRWRSLGEEAVRLVVVQQNRPPR